MKNLSILFCFMCLCFSANSQINTVKFDEASIVNFDKLSELVKEGREGLYQVEGSYIYIYPKTPVGLKHCIERVEKIVNANNLDFNNPDIDNVLLASYVDGIYDYELLHTSLTLGESEIKKAWEINNWYIFLHLTSDYYWISIRKP